MATAQILIVDDSMVAYQLLKKVTTGLPESVVVLNNYDDAYQYCVENRVDFLVTDCQLDNCHIAEELLQACAKNPRNKHTYFYLMTADLPDNFQTLKKQYNIHGCLIKPVSASKFRKFVEKLLNMPLH